jgi:dTDP-4-dehydrorhamnose reductase
LPKIRIHDIAVAAPLERHWRDQAIVQRRGDDAGASARRAANVLADRLAARRPREKPAQAVVNAAFVKEIHDAEPEQALQFLVEKPPVKFVALAAKRQFFFA